MNTISINLFNNTKVSVTLIYYLWITTTSFMEQLNFPGFRFRTRFADEGKQIWDETRKKYVALTPEEWVRQNLVKYLTEIKNYPASLIRVEAGIMLNRMPRRADIIVYSNQGKPLVIGECKAPAVKITQPVFDQIARYNIPLKVKYLLVTNGINHYCCRIEEEEKTYTFLREIPEYPDLLV
jgi:hypothetical protein